MITLNTDRGLVKVESWQEIIELPGFDSALDPLQHELKEIIGHYQFGDNIKCGLSNCHTPHMTGYVVATKSGPVTNIGQVCGKKYFGVEFTHLSRKLDQEIVRKSQADSIRECRAQIGRAS